MPKFVEVSVDEVMEHRKSFANDDGVLFKAIVSKSSWDQEARSATFIMSAETEDRHRDIVVQSGIKLDTFMTNPVALFNHNSWGTPIGTWSDIKQVNGRPKRTEGVFTAAPEGVDDMADKVARHIDAGTIKAASIGFRPLKMSRIDDDEGNWTYGYKFDEIELYECSIVTIPAVREALMKGAGNIKEIMSPEVVEEFLEHLKKNPAIAQMVDKQLFEDAYREATGNRTSRQVMIGVDTRDTKSFLKSFEALVARAEKAAGIQNAPAPEAPVDEITKELEKGIAAVLEEAMPKVDDVVDEERKTAIQSLIDGIKGMFAKDAPKERQDPAPEQPAIAPESVKDALRERLAAVEGAIDKTLSRAA